MAIYRIACNECKSNFLFDGDHYEKETTPRLMDDTQKERIIRFCDNCSTPNMIYVNPRAVETQIVPIQGNKASKDDVDMVSKGQSLIRDAPDRLDTMANTMIALNSGLVTVYTGALTLLKVPDSMGTLSPTDKLMLAIPIVSWIFSIFLYVGVYYPRKIGFYPSSPESVKAALKNVTERKYIVLVGGFIFFIFALLFASYIIGWGGINLAPPEQADPPTVQFIVPDDQLAYFKSMNVTIIDGTMRTSNVTLIDTLGGNYKI